MGGDHYSAIVEPEASPQEITNIVSNVQQNENATNSKTNDEGESERSESGSGGCQFACKCFRCT